MTRWRYHIQASWIPPTTPSHGKYPLRRNSCILHHSARCADICRYVACKDNHFFSKLKYVNCYSVCISSSMRLRPLTCSQCNCSANAFQSHLGKNPRSEDALKHLLISKVSMKKSVFVCMFQIFFVPLYL